MAHLKKKKKSPSRKGVVKIFQYLSQKLFLANFPLINKAFDIKIL